MLKFKLFTSLLEVPCVYQFRHRSIFHFHYYSSVQIGSKKKVINKKRDFFIWKGLHEFRQTIDCDFKL